VTGSRDNARLRLQLLQRLEQLTPERIALPVNLEHVQRILSQRQELIDKWPVGNPGDDDGAEVNPLNEQIQAALTRLRHKEQALTRVLRTAQGRISAALRQRRATRNYGTSRVARFRRRA